MSGCFVANTAFKVFQERGLLMSKAVGELCYAIALDHFGTANANIVKALTAHGSLPFHAVPSASGLKRYQVLTTKYTLHRVVCMLFFPHVIALSD